MVQCEAGGAYRASDRIVSLVERYKRERDRFEKLATIVSRRLSARLSADAIPHVPTFRTKEPSSLWSKLGRESEKLDFDDFRRELSQVVKDLAGVRVLLYRPQDIEPACAIIEKLFSVPQPEKYRRDYLEPGGYRARHRVVYLKVEDTDADLGVENLRFTLCEIQIATLGDPIWNELNHDIVYKTPHGEPNDHQTGLLSSLRAQLNDVGGTVVELMEATDRQRAAASAAIESPDELRRALESRARRRLVGNFEELLDLLRRVLREVTAIELYRLPLSAADFEAADRLLNRVGESGGPERLGLVIAALWPLYGEEFFEIVERRLGRPSSLARTVRALNRAVQEGRL